jgi:glutaredoxin
MTSKLFTIYTTSAFECPWCIRVKELLNIYGFDFYELDINNPRLKKEFLEQGFKTVPQVFFEDKHIGGYETTKDWVRNKFFENYSPDRKQKIIDELENIT